MLKFKSQGYVCAKDNTEISLLVEGGTVIFDMDSLASSATSNFNFLLNLAYGEQQDVEDGKRHRYIKFSSTSPSSSLSSSFSTTSSCCSYGMEISYETRYQGKLGLC